MFTFTVGRVPIDFSNESQTSMLYENIAKRVVPYLYNKKLSFEENLKLITHLPWNQHFKTDLTWNQHFIQYIKFKNYSLKCRMESVYSIDIRLDINDIIPPVSIRFCTPNFEGVIEYFKGDRHFKNSCYALLTKLNQDKHIDYCSSLRGL